MRNLYIALLFLLASLGAHTQEFNPHVNDIINEVNLDSLIYQLRNLSGEDPVVIGGETTTIEHRVSNWGNNLAAQYIFETLEGFGLDPFYQDYSSGGRNVLAIQEGTQYPEEYYIICAHYDAVTYYAADDNGSGTAGVLEAARIFSDLQFEYSIIYALWDEEEIGMIGSNYYATQAAANDQVIHAVINMDMIAWDGDEDMVAEIHNSSLAGSDQLASYILDIDNIYELQVNPTLPLENTSASDHSSFWNNGYAAVLVIEEYKGGDFNPEYHKVTDRINILNMPYFHEMAKLCIASIADMANPVVETSVDVDLAGIGFHLRNYPNPFNHETSISYALVNEGYVRLSVINGQGQEVGLLEAGIKEAGEHQLVFNATHLPEGLYFINLQTNEGSMTHKVVVQ